MPDFESWKQYFEFSHFVRRKARHILDAQQQKFLDSVLETSSKRRGSIEKGSELWRAQLAHALEAFDLEAPASPERMMPWVDRAQEGRVNPKGIPCLYLSTERDTAMTEVRPWIGSCVSVGRCVMLRDLTVVDCSADSARRPPWASDRKDSDPARREEYIWGDINRAFSEPVTRSDDIAEYSPTQVLAEAFRSIGFDGIVYGSKLGTGKTVAIFDLIAAEIANCELYRVEGVGLKFSMAANPYYLKKYCDEDQSSD